MINFADTISERIKANNSILCFGIDPRLSSKPFEKSVIEFYAPLIKASARRVAAIKLNIAFFEAHGARGVQAFIDLASLCRDSSIPVIADIKRGDIGSTAEAYAAAYLESDSPFPVDAITVNPFLGFDTLEPFIEAAKKSGKGIFVLLATSNPGARDIQQIQDADVESVSEKIAHYIASKEQTLRASSGFSSLGVVVGATNPFALKRFRELLPTSLFLIPGFGAQGGSVEGIHNSIVNGQGSIVSASRSLIEGIEESDSESIKIEKFEANVSNAIRLLAS